MPCGVLNIIDNINNHHQQHQNGYMSSSDNNNISPVTTNSESPISIPNLVNGDNSNILENNNINSGGCVNSDVFQKLETASCGSNGVLEDLLPRCTGCKSKKSDAVAKCIDCANYLCANCVTAHQFMHCFDGHNVFRIKSLCGGDSVNALLGSSINNNTGGSKEEFLNEDDDIQFIHIPQQQQLLHHPHHMPPGLHHDHDDDLFHDQQQQQHFLANKIMNSFDTHRLALSFKDDIILGNGTTNGPNHNGGSSSSASSASSASSSCSTTATAPTAPINFTGKSSNGIIGSGLTGLLDNSTAIMSPTNSLLLPGGGNGEGGNVVNGKLIGQNGGNNSNSSYFCQRHKNEILKYFCRTCQHQICKDCIVIDHPTHEYELLNGDATTKQIESLLQIVSDVRNKATDMRQLINSAEYNNERLLMQYRKAQNEISDTHNFYRSLIEDRKQEVIKELDNLYNCKSIRIHVLLNKTQEHIEKVLQSCEFVERLSKQAGPAETIMLRKVMENKLQSFLQYVQDLQSLSELEFLSNYQAIQANVRNSFGYIRSTAEHLGNGSNGLDALTANNNLINSIMSSMPSTTLANNKQPPIARPTSTLANGMMNGVHYGHTNGGTTSPSSSVSNGSLNMNLMNGHHSLSHHQNGQMLLSNGITSSSSSSMMAATTSSSSNSSITNGMIIERPFSNGNSANQHNQFDTSNMISKRFNSSNSLGPFVGDMLLNGGGNGSSGGSNGGSMQLNPYEKWSNGGSDNNMLFNQSHLLPNSNSNSEQFSQLNLNGNLIADHSSVLSTTSVIDLTTKLMSSSSSVTSMFPPKSQIKRQKMIYHCKFGEFGVMEGQFTEPSGVAVNAQNDIIVADTNNHRIQIFDKEGRFKFQFGECGKRDGQLLYPNRVAVVRTSGDIIVTERSPTHQIQIYNQYGQFVRKFGANILQHPRGVTVDNKGRIIVVECKVMRVIIFDQNGVVLQKFGCSKHLEFPNGVVVNDKQEIFISDNRAHCVKVFNYEGVYLRQIGGEGITNYPIGVGINQSGEILIADNHNNFNLTIFTQDGQLVSALESKVKHAQCFDVALMDDGSVVLASKDYRLYIYRYVQVPPIGL